MDAKFYQFWEDFFKHAVGGQVAPDVLTGWSRLGGSAMPDELMAMFKKYYGLDQMSAEAPDYSILFESALKEFNQSLTNLYAILDVVPKQDYVDLEKKCKALERKVADLEGVIMQLKLLFKTNPPNIGEGIGSLNQMLKSQNEQFLKMMDNLAGFYGISKDTDTDKK